MTASDATAPGFRVQEEIALTDPSDVRLLQERVERLRRRMAGRRLVIGIVGEPGAGKSTLATALVEALGDEAALVPMDGYHLSNRILEQHGTRDRKGAPETFDAGGFVHLVERLRRQDEEVVYAPEFLRELDEPVAGSIAVDRTRPVVLVEGNYLLLDEPPWDALAGLLDDVWYLVLDDRERLSRLARRHETFGLTNEEADRWARVQDERNARLIRATRHRASLVVHLR